MDIIKYFVTIHNDTKTDVIFRIEYKLGNATIFLKDWSLPAYSFQQTFVSGLTNSDVTISYRRPDNDKIICSQTRLFNDWLEKNIYLTELCKPPSLGKESRAVRRRAVRKAVRRKAVRRRAVRKAVRRNDGRIFPWSFLSI